MPSAAQHVAHFVSHQFFHLGAGRGQILARIKLLGILSQHLADGGGHGHAQVGVDVDLGATDPARDFNVRLGHARRVFAHLAAVFVDFLCDVLGYAGGTVEDEGIVTETGFEEGFLDGLKAFEVQVLLDAGMGDYPLVLHGASSVPKEIAQEINKYGGAMGEETAGVPEADIEIARRIGCTKVNIDTDLRMAMTAAIRKVFATNPKEFDPRKYLGPARTAVKELVRHKVRDVLCCAGHAFD